uniref:Uncharacterized protein n=1 Tax=Onchocerca volvulus TaxID=6282 RepID=A0A8R1TV40_ONCVO
MLGTALTKKRLDESEAHWTFAGDVGKIAALPYHQGFELILIYIGNDKLIIVYKMDKAGQRAMKNR